MEKMKINYCTKHLLVHSLNECPRCKKEQKHEKQTHHIYPSDPDFVCGTPYMPNDKTTA